ncbi:TA2R7 protein, partial [Brachypodius atriceps]|nr:TA2R7 protein [Brachypodius atriceps]
SPQQDNVTSHGATALAIITLEVFAGMWINAFIVGVLCMSWVKKKALSSNEKILLLLGSSRFCFFCFFWVFHFLSVINPNYIYVNSALKLLAFFTTFLDYSNLWVSACLCGFYCIKIANFRNRFFIYLKVKIDRMVSWLLLGSVPSALAMAIIIYNGNETIQRNLNFTCLGNVWEATIRMDKHFFSSFFLAGFGYAALFMEVIFSALFLLFSLWRHKCKMQTNSMKDLSVEAHIKAMKSIVSFLVMYSINFGCLVLAIIYIMKNETTMTILVNIFLCAFPGAHSLILIFSNPKLEKALLKILSCVK